MLATLPAPTRNGGARLPAVSRGRSGPPTPSRRVLYGDVLPPLPALRFQVAADFAVVVRQEVELRVVARVAAVLTVDVDASATARADGGTKDVDADLTFTVTVSAAVRVRYRRTAAVNVAVDASARATALARADLALAVTAAATQYARANVAAALNIASTVTAEIVAIGGSIPVDAVLNLTVTPSATALARIYRAAAATVTVDATAERLIRMRAAAVQDVAIAATATVRVPVKADLNITVTPTATARLAFDNSGMTKNGTQLVASTSSSAMAYTLLTPWSIRAGFGTTLIEDNGIRVPAGVTVNITYRVPFDAQPGPSNWTYSRLTNDGVEIPGSVVYNTGYSTAGAITLTGLVGTGGIVRVEALGNGTASRRTVTADAFLEIIRA
ncbi:hypothetical protein [Rhodococcoides fascians]|uniref:hypothetical protein n=1 Tax=Rhodococcoides fascians TaxID=1828 RepID=UPI0005614792|nr:MULTISPECIES: hypothetical protein [Rhodococcus]OZE98065.1 hypothetical protein CH301_17115 [Rhodococcus sp. 15-1189-1-1a]OZF12715.1 hypothetical protein CH299_17800 [Rhodococcus sp. 14-2686-1-2]